MCSNFFQSAVIKSESKLTAMGKLQIEHFKAAITVLGAFVLTLNWEPATFFCKSDADLAD